MKTQPTLAHRAEYALFAGAAAAGRALGDGRATRLGAWLGRLGYSPFGIRRGVVLAQLRLAFPGRDETWIRATARDAYAHLGMEAMAMLRLAGTTPAQVVARTEVTGLDELRAILDAGHGAVVVTGHLGNWELGGAALAARGFPMEVVAQRQANPLFDRTITCARERLGMRVIDRKQAPKLALRALRSGRVVAFVADQDAREAGVFVPFFGRPASTHRGPALMALRTGAPVFLGIALRAPGGGHRVRLEQVSVDTDGLAGDEAVARLTAAFTARLESAIRAAPGQYLWHHRRWKTRPPEELAGGVPGI